MVVDSLFIASHIDYGGSVFGPYFVIQCLCPSSFAIIFGVGGKVEKRASCFTLIFLL